MDIATFKTLRKEVLLVRRQQERGHLEGGAPEKGVSVGERGSESGTTDMAGFWEGSLLSQSQLQSLKVLR